MDYLDLIFFVAPVYLFAYSILFFVIGIRGLIIHKPTVLNSKVRLVLFVIAIVPCMIISFFTLNLNNELFDLNILLPIIFILYLAYSLYVIKGYNVYCVNDDDFRNAIIESLNKNNIKFEEKMNIIELFELKNQINVLYASWLGNGTIKFKQTKNKILFNKIMMDIKDYHKSYSKTTKIKFNIFYILFALLYLILTIVSGYYALNIVNGLNGA
ncbi:MAG: hypothetical protein LBV17_03300 [Treponema sp.]|jgi:hypothetical protein|nr:hypothetical protein [Treponema sp.]